MWVCGCTSHYLNKQTEFALFVAVLLFAFAAYGLCIGFAFSGVHLWVAL